MRLPGREKDPTLAGRSRQPRAAGQASGAADHPATCLSFLHAGGAAVVVLIVGTDRGGRGRLRDWSQGRRPAAARPRPRPPRSAAGCGHVVVQGVPKRIVPGGFIGLDAARHPQPYDRAAGEVGDPPSPSGPHTVTVTPRRSLVLRVPSQVREGFAPIPEAGQAALSRVKAVYRCEVLHTLAWRDRDAPDPSETVLKWNTPRGIAGFRASSPWDVFPTTHPVPCVAIPAVAALARPARCPGAVVGTRVRAAGLWLRHR